MKNALALYHSGHVRRKESKRITTLKTLVADNLVDQQQETRTAHKEKRSSRGQSNPSRSHQRKVRWQTWRLQTGDIRRFARMRWNMLTQARGQEKRKRSQATTNTDSDHSSTAFSETTDQQTAHGHATPFRTRYDLLVSMTRKGGASTLHVSDKESIQSRQQMSSVHLREDDRSHPDRKSKR